MKYLLMNYKEPSDLELIVLMKEVAKDAKNKAILEKKHLRDTIMNQITNIQAQLKANRG